MRQICWMVAQTGKKRKGESIKEKKKEMSIVHDPG
jgi:hypothetical protein